MKMMTVDYWLANQSVRQRIESQKGRLFAPFVDRAGRRRRGYSNMTELRPGDVVLAYFKGAITAVAKVTSASRRVKARSALPDESAEEQNVSGRHAPGWEAEVNYFHLKRPVLVEDIDNRLRTRAHGPFTAGQKVWGTVIEGQYLMPVSKAFIKEVHRLSGGNWPRDRSPR
jgi:hypothetical protein